MGPSAPHQFCSQVRRQTPLNAPRRGTSKKVEEGGRLSGGELVWGAPPPPHPAWTRRHGAAVVYIKADGEGIGGGLSTATADSLWKMPQLPILDGDVIRVKRAFP